MGDFPKITEDMKLGIQRMLRDQMENGFGGGGKRQKFDPLARPVDHNTSGGGGWGGWGGSWAKHEANDDSEDDSKMKAGGMVRGCGKAERGRTKGKFV